MSILQDLIALNQKTETIVENEDLDNSEAEDFAEELQELHNKMVQLMEEVRQVVRQLPRSMRGSAESYWVPHIMIALGGEHGWMTAGHESTMQKTIDELKEYGEDGRPESEDDGGESHEM